MNEIHEHRRMAILGNKQEKMVITNKYQQESMQLDKAKKAQQAQVHRLEQDSVKKQQMSFMQDCQRRDQEAANKR